MPDEARRRARLRTLLPIIRNVLFIVLATTAVLMALASTGVQIAPLIAGAGVVGVAIGFGAQSIVKDIIAGMFFVLDDAFRVGEYIVSGNVKGTVEFVLAALGEAPPPARPALHGAFRLARRHREHEPRLGDRQARPQRHLRYRRREGEEDRQEGERRGHGGSRSSPSTSSIR